jgi:mono/diheme cytochrome c family protein
VRPKHADRASLSRTARPGLLLPAVLLPTVLLLGCGGSDGVSQPALSPDATTGLQIAKANGCMTCHSVDGRTGLGPTWQGLYGSEVELDDGTRVVADDEYLTNAIEHPGDQIVEGYNAVMPDRELSADDVASIVTYLRSLAD